MPATFLARTRSEALGETILVRAAAARSSRNAAWLLCNLDRSGPKLLCRLSTDELWPKFHGRRRVEAGRECAALGRRACFEAHPGCVASLLISVRVIC